MSLVSHSDSIKEGVELKRHMANSFVEVAKQEMEMQKMQEEALQKLEDDRNRKAAALALFLILSVIALVLLIAFPALAIVFGPILGVLLTGLVVASALTIQANKALDAEREILETRKNQVRKLETNEQKKAQLRSDESLTEFSSITKKIQQQKFKKDVEAFLNKTEDKEIRIYGPDTASKLREARDHMIAKGEVKLFDEYTRNNCNLEPAISEIDPKIFTPSVENITEIDARIVENIKKNASTRAEIEAINKRETKAVNRYIDDTGKIYSAEELQEIQQENSGRVSRNENTSRLLNVSQLDKRRALQASVNNIDLERELQALKDDLDIDALYNYPNPNPINPGRPLIGLGYNRGIRVGNG